MASISIKQKLFGLGGVVVLSFLVFAGVYTYSVKIRSDAAIEAKRVSAIQHAEAEAEIALLNARRYEKDFLLHGESTQEQADAWQKGHSEAMRDFYEELKIMEDNIQSVQVKEAVTQLNAVAHKYEQAFDETAATKAMVGYNEKLGLLGRLRDSVHAVEHILKAEHSDKLTVKMLMMRRHEKDFMMRLKDKYLQEMAKRKTEFSALLAKSSIPTAKKAEITGLMEGYHQDFNAFAAGMKDVRKATENIEQEVEATEPAFEKVEGLVNDLQKQNEAVQQSANNRIALLLIVSMILGGVVILGSVILLAFAISKGLDEAVRVCKNVAQGKLGLNIRPKSNDEIGQLLESLKFMDENLMRVVNEVQSAVANIGAASQEIAQGNTSLSQRTEEQASSLEETASSMEEMTGTVKQNADSAAEARQLADANRQRASTGADVVLRTVEAMSEINQSSSKISDIITTIDGIAFQTNLLALNAAVEAARAGEQGRGFAVVASEVRSLAQRSAEAAKEIKALIEDSVGKVRIGTQLVDESGKTLEEIIVGAQKVADIIAEIAAASQEQASGIDQVNNAITQMDNMTQDNAALVEEAAAASRAMQEQAHNLNQLMSFFRVDTETQLQSRAPTHLPGNGNGSLSGERSDKVKGNGKGEAEGKELPSASNRSPLEHLKHAKGKPTTNDTSEWEQF